MRLIDRKSCPTCRFNHSFCDGTGYRWRVCGVGENLRNCKDGRVTNTSMQDCQYWEIKDGIVGEINEILRGG